MKRVSLRVVTGLVITAILLTTLVAYLAWAATPSSNIWVSPGIYPGAPDYTVWREGSNYFAKNQNGHIDYSSTNASDVINDAFSTGNHVLSAVEYGTLTNSIILDDGQVFEGLYFLDDDVSIGASFTLSANVPAIIVSGSFIQVRNLKLVSKSGNTEPLIEFNESAMERHCLLENLGLIVYGHDAITIGNTGSFWNIYRNIRAVNFGTSYDCYALHSNDTQIGPGHLIQQLSSYEMGLIRITGTQALVAIGLETDITSNAVNPVIRLSSCRGITFIGINIESEADCPVNGIILANCRGTFSGRLWGLGHSANTFFPVTLNSGSVMCFDGLAFYLTRSNRDWTCSDANTTVYIHSIDMLASGAFGYYSVNSGNNTGTGSEQEIAHGLHGTPSKVILWDIENAAAPYQSSSANSTHIFITAGSGLDYGWEASV